MIPRGRILIVDDQASVLLTTGAILREEGYDTLAVAGGAAALAAIRDRHFDLVLTDLKMPEVDGLQVLQEVRKCSPDTVTIMMTGYASLDSALEAVQLGAYEYLLKPISVPDLKAAVRRSLERKRLSEIDTLYRISRTLANTPGVAHIRSEVTDAVRRVLNVARATLITCDRDSAPRDASSSFETLPDWPALSARLAKGDILTCDDAEVASWAAPQGLHSVVLVPGIAGDRLVCVLVADNGAEPFDFHASALRFLRGLATQTALAVENAALISELQQNNRELQAANEKLRELDRLKSQFLSIATHELRTPLSVILGYNAMLEESLGNRLTAEESDSLRESVQACKRLIRLVNSMLDVSQIESGKMRMNYSSTDLRRLASGVISLFQQEARRRGIHLGLELPARLPRVHLDSERIEQVLVNLIGNALKFTPAGAITVSVRAGGDMVELAVSDTGIGIAAAAQGSIFEEFTQLEAGHLRGEGSGLGLAIARRIVEAHHGRIEVESTPGRGSTFRCSLPLREPHSARGAVSA